MRRFRALRLIESSSRPVFAKLRRMQIGTLQALTRRTTRRAPPRQVDSADAVAARGLLGDAHADRYSPRQLLLADADVYRELALPPHALRENLLIDIDTAALESGTVLQVGNEVLLRLMFQCEACGNLDAFRPGLSRMLAKRRGMLARVITGGTLRAGDRIRDLGQLLPAWPDDWHERVLMVLDALPLGSVIEYRDLARLAGVQSTYCRAFPRMIRNLGPDYAGRAVAANDPVAAPRWHGEGLFEHPSILHLV
jgi:hypothetical protein